MSAISFSDGIAAGLPFDDAAPAPEPADVAPDTPPIEHNDILTTPVMPPAPPKGKRKTALRTSLEGMYATAGTLVYVADQQTGTVILEQGPKCAEALDELAQKDPKIKAALESMLSTSAWGAVIAAHLPILVQVGTTYIPPLTARYKSQMANREQSDA